jgi:hypothetical protein
LVRQFWRNLVVNQSISLPAAGTDVRILSPNPYRTGLRFFTPVDNDQTELFLVGSASKGSGQGILYHVFPANNNPDSVEIDCTCASAFITAAWVARNCCFVSGGVIIIHQILSVPPEGLSYELGSSPIDDKG